MLQGSLSWSLFTQSLNVEQRQLILVLKGCDLIKVTSRDSYNSKFHQVLSNDAINFVADVLENSFELTNDNVDVDDCKDSRHMCTI